MAGGGEDGVCQSDNGASAGEKKMESFISAVPGNSTTPF